MSHYYAPCFKKNDFIAIPSYKELPWIDQKQSKPEMQKF